jgi:electron transfer flavoprotein alpha subunit
MSRRLVALVLPDDAESVDPYSALAAAGSVCAATPPGPGRAGNGVEALIVGVDPDDAAEGRARELGATVVWRAAHPGLAKVPAHALAEALEEAAAQAIAATGTSDAADLLVLAPGDPLGEQIAAGLAARLDGVPLGRCTELTATDDGLRCRRAAYAGRAEVERVSWRGPWFATLRAGRAHAAPRDAPVPASSSAPATGATSLVPAQSHRIVLDGPLSATRVESRLDTTTVRKPVLEGARIVVSGGRGIGGPEGFALLDQLADALGGAMGGSLPTVDAGWVPVSRQVGQSGKYVTPGLYVAVAISGTPQHLAGIGPDTRIYAVNNDPEADIFRVADVGVIADWKLLLPLLLEELRR